MRIDERVLAEVARSTRFGPVTWVEAVDSTNRWAADAAARGDIGELVVVADYQTAGRGRLGRRWEAPPGAALLASIVLRPAGLEAARFHLLTALVALAGREACATAGGFVPDIKWPNDLLVGDRKLAGILAQTAPAPAAGGAPGPVVVGIGVNLTAAPPGAITAAEAAGRPVGRDELLGALLAAADRRYGRWDEVAAEYVSRCATVGRRVRVEGGAGAVREGEAEGIDRAGRLVVRFDGAGESEPVSAADVVHLRPAGGAGW
jgi:BirA family biotin operon repressor/biotin-[acetyl-CoA-carboxylase] ligase